ncbi:restriction endonuclease subunit M [Acetobacteraceae bacterium]|nr:restriction endonuclease subunit M [Acetobacteraceae bacterium]
MEPKIAELGNGWLKSYGLPYKLEQESLNSDIDNALFEYASKSGGTGGNRPDAKLLLQDKTLAKYPILIEYKGHKDKLEKLNSDGQIDNTSTKGEILYSHIKEFAVNGAVHYANAILHYTGYSEIIAIGMTGTKNAHDGKIVHKIGVYYVSKSNLGIGQKVGEYTDFSFLSPKNFDNFIQKVKQLSLTDAEKERLREKREKEIDASLVALNNDIYANEKGISEDDRVYLVCASIIATLGVPGKVTPLEKGDLKSKDEGENRDGDIILRKIKNFLKEKEIPEDKRSLIVRSFTNILTESHINKPENGETPLKRIFSKVVDDLGIYYKINLTTDFTGKLFNEMYNWLGFSQDKLNDVVLTPAYVASLLVKLARVNKDSYVWDFATGSAGLLVAAMNEMLDDAKLQIKSPDELLQKELTIKAEQLLGLEILPKIYMLAVLNMILMGDGSSNLINEDSLKNFNGKYAFKKKGSDFPANAFVLNPPYSAVGKGMVFVEKALSMMKTGYAAIIIMASAGRGRGGATDFNKAILKKNTLIASIKMPRDLFAGKSSVQTCIYVFKVGEKHHPDEMVKFINFSEDGYTRIVRKKASKKLIDKDRAKERYQEIVDLVRFGVSKLNFYKDCYVEDTIDPEKGTDWNYEQHNNFDTKPTFDDFRRTVADYLAWEIDRLLKGESSLGK